MWGLPFDLITQKVRTRIENSMGWCVKVDDRSEKTEQACYLRIQVEIPLDKPLRRGEILSILKGRSVGPSIGMNVSLLLASVVVSSAMRRVIASPLMLILHNMEPRCVLVGLVRKLVSQLRLLC